MPVQVKYFLHIDKIFFNEDYEEPIFITVFFMQEENIPTGLHDFFVRKNIFIFN